MIPAPHGSYDHACDCLFPWGGGGEKEIGENDCVVGFENISIRSDSERRRRLVLLAIRGASDCLIV